MKKTLFALLSLGIAGSAMASNVNLAANQAVEFVPVSNDIVSVRADKATFEQTEWFDTWFADGGGPVWYTPELYTFSSGDTLEVVVFIHLEGATTNFVRIDAFYLCGASNPLGYVQTSGAIDFGPIPENAPNYGWITGVGYVLPALPTVSIDSASRVLWNGTTDCGVPLSGRPDCANIN